MSVTCTNCGAAVQLASSLTHQQLHLPNDPLIPFVKAQIDDLTAQNSSLVAENDSLASKLVESTEGRMDLDVQLNIAQMELQAAQTDLTTLRENQKHYEQLLSMISSGQLIEKKDVQPVIENLAYESQRRSQMETSKLQLESELEDLSRSLFEEANRMVNEERRATYVASKKIEGLERQLDEVLDLCKSERDQLVELKSRMGMLSDEKDAIQRERDAIEFAFVQLQQQTQHHHQQYYNSQLLNSSPSPTSMHHHMSTTAAARRGIPITPSGSPNISAGLPYVNMEAVAGSRKHVQQILQYDARQHRSSASSVKSKTDSCYFSDEDHPGSHLINDPNDDRVPSLGFHLWDPSFIEFKAYMESIFGSSGKNAAATADSSLKTSQPSTTSSTASSTATTMYSFGIISKTTTPAAPATNAVIPMNSLLSNCRLLKKMSSEDVEATLRFEPGNLLSWTQRKRLMTAVTENTLVVEAVTMGFSAKDPAQLSPVATSATLRGQQPSTSTTQSTAGKPSCALCGHGITTPLYYQYRLLDTSNESRTICPYCRTRLTSVCTFYSVLRMISKRIISGTTTPEKLYLDFLRIRLGMFLARCGVGIITGEELIQKRESMRSQLAVSNATSPQVPDNINNGNTANPPTKSQQSSSSKVPAMAPVTIITTNALTRDTPNSNKSPSGTNKTPTMLLDPKIEKSPTTTLPCDSKSMNITSIEVSTAQKSL
ncbi:rab guanine nucleotide exchange factor S2 [Dissophora globulifera]|uniref:Rab guanine nucleotide exchange factor S2 n=1 Tax=Dissophora globulifera TaxID=979702 RepID=A0A9P6R4G1_9FUNG|nr:rab guanine nucleotide exchange factor S2 [Dissophora globulifera]